MASKDRGDGEQIAEPDQRLTADEKNLYLREIKKDIRYFGKAYERAHFRINISGLAPKQAACLVKDTFKERQRGLAN